MRTLNVAFPGESGADSILEDRVCARALKDEIDRPLARWTGAVERARRYGDELPRLHHHLAVREFDDKLAVDAEEGLVRVRVPMPAVSPGHDAHADLVI